MKTHATRAAALALGALGAICASTVAATAELQVLSTNALQSALEALVADYNQGHSPQVKSEFSATAVLARRLQDGAAADVFLGTRSVIDELAGGGKIRAGTAVDLARSRIGVAVRQGAARPDIATPEALRRTLLAARSISYTDPATGAISGVHFQGVLESLGIADVMRAKTRHPPVGGFSARLLVSGEADLAIQQIAELLTVPGIDIVGPLPEALQKVTLFAAAVPASATQADAGRAFIRYLQLPQSAAVMRAKGLEPVAAPAETKP